MNILQADVVQRKGQDASNINFSGPNELVTGKPLPTAWTQSIRTEFTTPEIMPEASLKPIPMAWTQSIAGAECTTPEHVHEASHQLVAAGLSVIPIDAYEGSKMPDARRLPRPHDPIDGKQKPSWSAYMIRRPRVEELNRWYEPKTAYGLAVVCGSVSGGKCGFGLEVIDFDQAELAQPWMESVEKQAPGLVNRFVRVQSPRPGLHCYYRCSQFCTNQKLAMGIVKDDFGTAALDSQGNALRKTLIEVKAEGGYCLIPPSPPRCHPTGRLYQYVDGSLTLEKVPTITPAERAILLTAARMMGDAPEPKVQPVLSKRSKPAANSGSLDMPGNDFNARGSWDEILTPHGWKKVGQYGDEDRWCRPGKSSGISATTNYQDSGLLHVFTSSAAPLEADRSYSKFTAHAVLNHNGNFKEAAFSLSQRGYGKQNRIFTKR